MKNKQIIGIVGATGNMGTALSKSLSKAGYPLMLYSQDQKKIQSLQDELKTGSEKATTRNSVEYLARDADIIILAVPHEAEAEIAGQMKNIVEGKIVISITNPLNETYDGLVTGPDTSAAEELQALLPNAKVVKSFNTVFAADYAQPDIDGKKVDAFVAGDDDDAVNEIAEIVKAMGLNPLIAGKLSTSRTLEHMQLLLIQLNMKNNYNWRAGWKILH